ncbi:MAG: hypothetical protein WAM77_25430, partial [Xanthobacteraceae bacterium]
IGYRNGWRIRLLNMGLVAYEGLHDLRIVSARSCNAVGICTRDRCPIQIRSALVARAYWGSLTGGPGIAGLLQSSSALTAATSRACLKVGALQPQPADVVGAFSAII